MKNNKLIMILAAGLALSACSNQAPADKATKEVKQEESQVAENNDAVKEVTNDTKAAAKEPIPSTEKTLEEAIDAFYAHYKDEAIELTSAELDEENGKYCYGVKGFKDGQEYEAVLDANTLEIISEKIEAEDDTKVMAIDRKAIITGKEAMEKALEGQAENVYIEGYELEVENG